MNLVEQYRSYRSNTAIKAHSYKGAHLIIPAAGSIVVLLVAVVLHHQMSCDFIAVNQLHTKYCVCAPCQLSWLLLLLQGVLFPALRRVKLIPEDADISTLQYSRCGRTDKGVSALGQVKRTRCLPVCTCLAVPHSSFCVKKLCLARVCLLYTLAAHESNLQPNLRDWCHRSRRLLLLSADRQLAAMPSFGATCAVTAAVLCT